MHLIDSFAVTWPLQRIKEPMSLIDVGIKISEGGYVKNTINPATGADETYVDTVEFEREMLLIYQNAIQYNTETGGEPILIQSAK